MEPNEVLTTARNFLKERTDSLQNDVKRCCFGRDEETAYAPFPALLYCFSTIDLLGALYGGNAKGDPTNQSREYMTKVMRYPKEKVFMLQEVFRHKIVHLAQPNPKRRIGISTIEAKTKSDKDLQDYLKSKVVAALYSWGIKHDNRAKHLTIEKLDSDDEGDRVRFWVSIWSVVEDIVDSVHGTGGYLHTLQQDEKLRTKFDKAHGQIVENEQSI